WVLPWKLTYRGTRSTPRRSSSWASRSHVESITMASFMLLPAAALADALMRSDHTVPAIIYCFRDGYSGSSSVPGGHAAGPDAQLGYLYCVEGGTLADLVSGGDQCRAPLRAAVCAQPAYQRGVLARCVERHGQRVRSSVLDVTHARSAREH